MGCGGSKLDPEDEAVPPRLRPLLRRRLEEIKKRRQTTTLKGDAISRKELLKNEVEDDDHSPVHSLPDNNETKSSSSRDGSIRSAKVAPAPEECQEEAVNWVDVEGEDDEGDGEDGRRIAPGSPSFRVYCVESSESDKEDFKDDDSSNKKSQTDDGSVSDKSVSSTERSVVKTDKKGSKRRRFKGVLPNGGSVKHLFKVKSCYNPSCTGNHDARLLSGKPAA